MALFKKMFDQTKGGRGVLKSELSERFTFVKFFKLLGRKFWRIAALNLMFVATNFPFIFFLLNFAGYGTVQRPTPVSPYWFGLSFGVSRFEENPATSLITSLCGITAETGYPTWVSTLFLVLGFLILFTFGLSNVGMAYVLRNYTREEPVDLVDYFKIMKKNWKQGLVFGVFDFFFMFMVAWNLILFMTGQGTMLLMTVISTAACSIYLMMRSYFYVLMVTFDLSIYKIIKNSLIFVFVNVKRNIIAYLGILLCYIITAILLWVATPFGAMLLLGLLFSVTTFMGIYAAYPSIKQYMIDPVIAEERKKRADRSTAAEKDSIFTDNG